MNGTRWPPRFRRTRDRPASKGLPGLLVRRFFHNKALNRPWLKAKRAVSVFWSLPTLRRQGCPFLLGPPCSFWLRHVGFRWENVQARPT